jgi:glucose/arabinose dehydrogenase
VRAAVISALVAALTGTSGCFAIAPSGGGGRASFTAPRAVDPGAVAVPRGFRVDAVATGLTFPTGVAFDDAGGVYVTESGYAYGETWTTPRLLRIEPGGRTSIVASGAQNGPWNGVTFHDGAFFVAEGGELEGGRILRIDRAGRVTDLVTGLPSRGDHHTNGPVAGPDGWIYFGQGTVTNSGVVGADNADFGWLARVPTLHDVPCADVRLTGERFAARDVRAGARGTVTTGAFAAFGDPGTAGRVVAGALPCNGSVMRVRPAGGPVELVAWGFRNPFALAFAPDGRLYAADNSYDDRGSRPVHGAGDLLWEVRRGVWYGWPDFHGPRRLDDGDHYTAPGKAVPRPLLASHPNAPPAPAATLAVHGSSDGFDFSRTAAFGWVGQAFVAQFGDQAPGVGKVLGPVGFKVVRVDIANGVVTDFAVNGGTRNGPASLVGGGGLERPIAARFTPDGSALYVVDFGVLGMRGSRSVPHAGTGVLWRIARADDGRTPSRTGGRR